MLCWTSKREIRNGVWERKKIIVTGARLFTTNLPIHSAIYQPTKRDEFSQIFLVCAVGGDKTYRCVKYFCLLKMKMGNIQIDFFVSKFIGLSYLSVRMECEYIHNSHVLHSLQSIELLFRSHLSPRAHIFPIIASGFSGYSGMSLILFTEFFAMNSFRPDFSH